MYCGFLLFQRLRGTVRLRVRTMLARGLGLGGSSIITLIGSLRRSKGTEASRTGTVPGSLKGVGFCVRNLFSFCAVPLLLRRWYAMILF